MGAIDTLGKCVALAGHAIGEFNYQAMERAVMVPNRITCIDLASESLGSQLLKRRKLATGFVRTFKQLPGWDGWSGLLGAGKDELHGGFGTYISPNNPGRAGSHEETDENT
jgi:hypothetical protein